jgi:hypothetical protein
VMVDVADPSVVIDNDDAVRQHLEEVSPRKRMSLGRTGPVRFIDQC